jgi:hypothetical protein
VRMYHFNRYHFICAEYFKEIRCPGGRERLSVILCMNTKILIKLISKYITLRVTNIIFLNYLLMNNLQLLFFPVFLREEDILFQAFKITNFQEKL